MHFQRLEDLRIDNDKTQAEIAEYLGCQREVYRRYEKGTRQIPLDFAIKLSSFYDVSIDYIVGITNEKSPYPRCDWFIVNTSLSKNLIFYYKLLPLRKQSCIIIATSTNHIIIFLITISKFWSTHTRFFICFFYFNFNYFHTIYYLSQIYYFHFTDFYFFTNTVFSTQISTEKNVTN